MAALALSSSSVIVGAVVGGLPGQVLLAVGGQVGTISGIVLTQVKRNGNGRGEG